MRYRLYYLKQEKELFTRRIEEIENIISIIQAFNMRKEIEEKAKCLIVLYKDKLKATEKEIESFENTIENIADEEVRDMAKCYFIDLKTYGEIGDKYYLDRTTVCKKLKRYFELWLSY